MTFEEWESLTRKHHKSPESLLALNTLRICIDENSLDDININQPFSIASNDCALLDFTVFSYFLFRSTLSSFFSSEFINEYRKYMQYHTSICFGVVFNLPHYKFEDIISTRFNKYETIANNSTLATTELIDAFIEFLKNDLAHEFEVYSIGLQFSNNYKSSYKEFDLSATVKHALTLTLEKLEKLISPKSENYTQEIDIRRILLNIDINTLEYVDERMHLEEYHYQCKQLNSSDPDKVMCALVEIKKLEASKPIKNILKRELSKLAKAPTKTKIEPSRQTKHKTPTKQPESKTIAQKSPTSPTPQIHKLPSTIIFCIVTCAIMALLYFIAVLDLPIGYYTFLRIFSLITLAASIIAYALQMDNLLNPVTYTQAPIAILFNPLAPIYLDKEIWIVLDIICGIAMLAIAVYIYKTYTSKTK